MATTFFIIPNVRTKSSSIKESSGIEFLCPTNTVMTGRYHKGDENGKTKYATAIVIANGTEAKTTSEITSESFKESSGKWFVTDKDRVMVGRVHKGDENGKTFYVSAELVIDTSIKEPAPN